MLTFLLGLIGYVAIVLGLRRLKRKWPVLVRELEEWALATVLLLLIIGLVTLL